MNLNKKMVDFQHIDSKPSSTNILIKFIKLIKSLGVLLGKMIDNGLFGNNIYITLHRPALLGRSFIDQINQCHGLMPAILLETWMGKKRNPFLLLSCQFKAKKMHIDIIIPKEKKYNKNRKRPKFPCINYYTSWSSLRLIKLC